MNSTRHMILGAFIAIALGVLGYYTLFLTEFDFLGEKHEVTVYFPTANGLREGDAVLVAGIRWGKVKTLEYLPTEDADHRIRVVANLSRPLSLWEGNSFEIRDATMLGGRLLVVDPGPPDAQPLPSGAEILGTVSANPLDALGELVNDNSEALTETLDNLNAVTSDLRNSQGLLGRVVNDEGMADEFASAISNLEQVSAQLAEGQGTIGKLLSDDTLYNDLTEIGTNLNTLIADANLLVNDIRGGEGLIPRLINDPELSDDVRVHELLL